MGHFLIALKLANIKYLINNTYFMQNNPELAKSLAVKYYEEGFNCAQSILKAYGEVNHLDLSQLIKSSSSLGSGMKSGCVCGALVGAELLLGLLYSDELNRASPDSKLLKNANRFSNDPKLLHMKNRTMHDQFKKIFGATCCRIIRGKEKRICPKIVETSMELLYAITE